MSTPVEPIVMLRSSDDAWEYMHRHWGYETTVRPDVKLKPVPYSKSVLYDFIESEGMNLLIGNDGHYYTTQDKAGMYGDYAWTEWTEYGRFESPDDVRAHLAN